MPQKFDPSRRDALLASDRAESLDPHRVFSFLPLRPYHNVADIGCGPGYFAVPLGKALWQGKVYALDVQGEMVEACRRQVQQARLSNVEALQCGESDFSVPAGSLDGVLAAFVLHEAEDPPAFLRAIADLLKPRGWCALLEWFKREMEEGPPVESRMTQEEVMELARGAGLSVKEWRDLNGKQYIVMLRK